MGTGSEGIAATSTASKTKRLGSGEAHHVGSCPEEDRGVSTSTMGEVEDAAEEGCVAASVTRNQHAVPNVTFPD